MATKTTASKTPAERNKMIVAIVLGSIAMISLVYMLFGGSSSPKKTAGASGTPRPAATPGRNKPLESPERMRQEEFVPTVVNYEFTQPPVAEAGRNIFAFYVPPPPKASPPPAAPTPIPTPPPVPPNLILASISPVNVYARTGDFTLDVTGDKFTPETRIFMSGAELQTRFVSPQQLSTKVPAQLISVEGAREVSVRSRDGALFSNVATLNVMPAPVPNFVFVGVDIRTGANNTAMLKEKNGKDILIVQRGDIVGGRFRVTSISVREVTLTDTTLNIKHPLQLTGERPSAAPPGIAQPRYTPPPPPASNDDDGEP
jgi:hypothetical protein